MPENKGGRPPDQKPETINDDPLMSGLLSLTSEVQELTDRVNAMEDASYASKEKDREKGAAQESGQAPAENAPATEGGPATGTGTGAGEETDAGTGAGEETDTTGSAGRKGKPTPPGRKGKPNPADSFIL